MTWGPMGRGGECPECKDLLAERDRLAAENAELKYWKQGNIRCASQLAAANATLDRLREIIPEHLTPGRAHRLYVNDVIRAKILLYPKETDNGN